MSAPTVGMRRLLSKWLEVMDVDEYRTSIICNLCLGQLTKYRNRRGRLSYSRLKCTTCISRGKPIFLDRDKNAAANILLVGEAPVRLLKK